MTRIYESPAVTLYGSVQALTSSTWKCTPAGDDLYAAATMTPIGDGKAEHPDTFEVMTVQEMEDDGCIHIDLSP